jgi:hypothetical protein
MPRALTWSDFLASLRESIALLRAHPFRWLILMAVFLAIIEGVTLVPYLGFFFRLALVGVLMRQWMLLFADAEAGRPPRRTWISAVWRPFSEAWVLVIARLVPFFAALVYLFMAGNGWDDVSAFFGHASSSDTLEVDRFFVFKLILHVAATPFVFMPAGIALCGQKGLVAIHEGLLSAVRNPGVLGFFVAIEMTAEVARVQLQSALQAFVAGPIVAIILIATVITFLTWLLAFQYAISTRAFSLKTAHGPLPSTTAPSVTI